MEITSWAKSALQSEIELSVAYGGTPYQYSGFIHIHNDTVPWNGDFNRAVGVKVSDYQSFDDVVEQVDSIHINKGLDKPNRIDIYPPELDMQLWKKHLSDQGYRLETALFFYTSTEDSEAHSDLVLHRPSESEYMDWFYSRMKAKEYYDDEWFEQLKIVQKKFIQKFWPYWLQDNNELVGWVYCANFGNYCRLFEVEIIEQYRGQEYGRRLLEKVKVECGKQGAQFVLLQSGERLREFYEKAGFQECVRNSIIWLK